MYNQPPGRNQSYQPPRGPASYGGQPAQGYGQQYPQQQYQPKPQSYPGQGYAPPQQQYQPQQQQYQPQQQYQAPPQQYNPPQQQYQPQQQPQQQAQPVKEEKKPRADTTLSPNALPATEVTFRDKVSVWWANDGPKWIWIVLWFLLNVALVVERFYHYTVVFRDGAGFKLIGAGLPIARSSAAGIKVNCALMLIMVLRNFLSWVRTTVVGAFVPTDKNIIFHRYMAWVIAFYTFVHVMGHYFNYYQQATMSDLNFAQLVANGNVNDPKVLANRNVFTLAFKKHPGITGYVATMMQILMYTSAIRYVRSPMFNVFWFTHHLFFPFYIILCFHSFNSIFEQPNFWAWVIAPLVFYLIERIVRVYRGNQDTILQLAIAHPSRVIELQMKKATFKYKPGQYLFLNCPYIARQEWHPFTISSAPEENFVSVHIRIVGDWTGELWAFLNPGKKLGVVQENVVTAPDGSPIFRIDGPFGAASEEVFDYNAVMLCAGGIGVTPFSSILKSINFKLKMHNQTAIEKVYFYWISRDKNAFEWINEILSALEQDNPRNFLEISTYLTGQLSVDEIRNVIYGLDQETDQITGLQSPTYFGRPNWDMIFAEKAERHKGRTVGVFFCGPAVLSKQLYKMSVKYTDAKTLTKFVYHKENF
eukprot:TRINITY_DN1519_c0_g2_i1.p1 TRINITY_DN1519_c0_g2~~TRINITY_DN1519_c0_g2_i1.p1  ORF type:complete len:645 (-),score=197.43 TRINITY_DN1519_c0_g2_i1:46-1980(-)